jgi:hypothetical protein
MKTMKKILICSLAICLMFSLASCAAKVEDTKTTQNTLVEGNTLTSSSPEQTIPTTTVKKSATEILAELVLEDGKGVLRPEMSKEEVINILNQYGVSYTEDNRFAQSDILNIEGGANYEKNPDASGFTIVQTKKGLKAGDPISKVYDLYEGAAQAYENLEGRFTRFMFDYGYEEGVGYRKLIIVSGDGTTRVDLITIGVYQTSTL